MKNNFIQKTDTTKTIRVGFVNAICSDQIEGRIE